MKKIITVLLALIVATGCTQALEESENGSNVTVATGKYQIFNSLNSNVTELYLYETGSKSKGENRVGDNGLKVGENTTLVYEDTVDTILTLEFVAEDGSTGKFDTLSIEEVPMNLLAEDARTGATVLEFAKPEGEGKYTVYNLTGGTLTELYIYEVGNDKGVNIAGDGIANGKSVNVTKQTSLDAVFVLEFNADNGENGIFETLHLEEAPICLLPEDARTGATAISFEEPK